VVGSPEFSCSWGLGSAIYTSAAVLAPPLFQRCLPAGAGREPRRLGRHLSHAPELAPRHVGGAGLVPVLVAGAGLVADEDMITADFDPLPTAGAAIQLLRHDQRQHHGLAVEVGGPQALFPGHEQRGLLGREITLTY